MSMVLLFFFFHHKLKLNKTLTKSDVNEKSSFESRATRLFFFHQFNLHTKWSLYRIVSKHVIHTVNIINSLDKKMSQSYIHLLKMYLLSKLLVLKRKKIFPFIYNIFFHKYTSGFIMYRFIIFCIPTSVINWNHSNFIIFPLVR